MNNKFRRILSVLLCALLILFAGTSAVYADDSPAACETAAEEFVCDIYDLPEESADSYEKKGDDALNYFIIGDSIARGSGLYNYEDACYGKIIADTNGYNYVNYGVDGLTSGKLLNLLKKQSVLNDLAEADIINLSIGGNNYFRGGNLLKVLVLGGVLKMDSVLDEVLDPFYRDFCKAIEIFRETSPDAVILVQTLYNPLTGVLSPVTKYIIDRLNDCFYRYVEENPGVITLVDVASKLNGHGYYFAIIHPTVSGNLEIAKTLLNTLYDMGLGKSKTPVITTRGLNTIEYLGGCILNPTKLLPI